MTDVALKEYLERVIRDTSEGLSERIHALSRLIDQQRLYSERAVEKAEFAVDKRLTGMNEFRDALKDQAGRMATIEQLDRLRDRVVEVEKRIAVTAAVVSLVISLVTGLVLKWFTP